MPGAGTFFCLKCGTQVCLQEDDALPHCPRCRGTSFRRDSIFEPMQEHGATTTVEFPSPAHSIPSGWLEEARASLPTEGRYLVARSDDEVQVFPVEDGWTRIGRSVAADIRLDHPSVSRRHALIISEADTTLRVLDDRSLNGVFVNGDEIEWGKLEDGDELRIGRFQLFVLEV
jgi:pSer/pThr/pTyr-binding forkhead associated (FHA) protein